MIDVCLKEDEPYSEAKLNEIIGNADKFVEAFCKAIPTGMKIQRDKIAPYSFCAVGLIVTNGAVIKCYPKYWDRYDSKKFKQLIKVIERYNSKEIKNGLNDFNCDKQDNYDPLSMMVFLMSDFFENGVYSNDRDLIEVNGSGEILWDKTVNESFALISRNRPFYPEMFTKKRISDEYDYFKRLHECILTKCSKELEDAGLLDLFDIDPIELSDDEISDFGDKEYILDRLQKELNVQFNTHKQEILKSLYVYISEDKHLSDCNFQTKYMVAKFHPVWEKVCKAVFNDCLNHTLKELAYLTPKRWLDRKFQNSTDKKLIDIINKPFWSKANAYSKPIEPDIVCFHEYEENGGIKNDFVILDAKYYCPVYGINKNGISYIDCQPGVEDINKQYLYQLCYKEFYQSQGFCGVKNCFIMPTGGDEVVEFGYASVGFLDALNLEHIQVRLCPAEQLYSYYLNCQILSVEWLKLD